MASPIKTGIVGYGISAKVFHAPFIDTMSEYELVGFVERSSSESAKDYPGTQIYRSFEEMLADPEIELVVITTPNETHFPFSKQALENGKHVVVEKPFTNTTEEGRELVSLAARSKTILSVYQNRRYVSDFLTMQDILDQKLLGEVHDFVAHYDRYRPEARPNAWREKPHRGSGILFDLGPHIIDQALYFFGLPESITADIRLQRPHAQVDDYFDIWLHYPTMKVTLHSGMLVREQGPRYMIHGSNGSYIKYGEDPQEAALRAGEKPLGDKWGSEPEDMHGILHTQIDGNVIRKKVASKQGNFGIYYQNLYQTIRMNAKQTELPEHGYNTIRIIELAFESSEMKATIPCSGLLDVWYPAR